MTSLTECQLVQRVAELEALLDASRSLARPVPLNVPSLQDLAVRLDWVDEKVEHVHRHLHAQEDRDTRPGFGTYLVAFIGLVCIVQGVRYVYVSLTET